MKAPFVLSRLQTGIWLADQLGRRSGGYLVPMALRLRGPLDVTALSKALDRIVLRHPVLRTLVRADDRGPVGITLDEGFQSLRVEDLAGGAAELDERLREEADRTMDLSEEPPFRARLFALGAQEHVLCMTVHHIAFDDWSRFVLYEELSRYYAPDGLPAQDVESDLPLRFHDVAAALEKEAKGTRREEQVEFWRSALAGGEALEIPPDHSRPARREGDGSVLTFRLGAEAASGLDRVGTRVGATRAMVFLAVCQAMFSRYTGLEDITLGTTMALRDTAGAENVIGPLLNLVTLRGDTSGNPSLEELVSRTGEIVLDAFEAKELPFHEVVEAVEHEHDPSRTPLFQILVDVGTRTRRPPVLQELSTEEVPIPWAGSKYDMNLWFGSDEDGVLCEIGWDSALYERGTVERLAERLETFLSFAAENSDRRIDEFPLLLEEERRLLDEFSSGGESRGKADLLHRLFEDQVRRTPDATAVVDTNRTSTYAELDEWADAIAARLIGHGVGPDRPVGVLMDRSAGMVAGLLGVLKAGGAYVPIEPDASSARVERLLNEVGARVCVVRSDRATHMTDTGVAPVDPESLIGVRTGYGASAPEMSPEHLCAIYFTSGSSGRPKGVACTHAGWVDRMRWMQQRFDLSVGETVLHKTTLTFDDSAVEIFWPLLHGGRVALQPPGTHADPRAIITAAIRYEAVHIQFVPSVLELFLEEITDQDVRRMPRLRSLLSSGEALPGSTVREHFERFGHKVTLENTWGPTESSIDSSRHTCVPEDGHGTALGVSIGRPTPGSELYVLNEELDLAPLGVPGELYVGGTGLARGYSNDPARTAEAFVPHPYRHGLRLYRTGDLAKWRPDGSLDFLGRRDRQVKVRGVRIELGEVENALRALPDISEAVVVPDTAGGRKRLVAYVSGGESHDTSRLKRQLTDRLASYAVPDAIVVMKALPRFPNGKLDVRSLPAPGAAPTSKTDHVAPRNVSEETVASIWTAVLDTPGIGVKDDFFDRGGNSLAAIRAVNRMRSAFHIDLPTNIVFEHSTVESCALAIEQIIIADIEAMSDEEVNKELDQK